MTQETKPTLDEYLSVHMRVDDALIHGKALAEAIELVAAQSNNDDDEVIRMKHLAEVLGEEMDRGREALRDLWDAHHASKPASTAKQARSSEGNVHVPFCPHEELIAASEEEGGAKPN